MNASRNASRGGFLRIVSLAGAGLTLGLEWQPRSARAETAATLAPTAFVRVGNDGNATVIVNKSEMGQGISTTFTMLVAEELDLPLARVRYEFAPAEPRYYDPVSHSMTTGGSTSVPHMTLPMRQAGATARAMLVAAAAAQWHVDPASCRTEAGVVIGPTGQRAPYAALVAQASMLPVPADVLLKKPEQFTLIGTRQKRVDLVPKTNGQAKYGIDVVLPGMEYASIEKPLEIGATLATLDASAALRVPGVRTVVPISSGVAVVANSTWAAFAGRKALRVTWASGPNASVSSDGIYARGRELVRTVGGTVKAKGDALAALSAGSPIAATYEIQYAAHAPMEPMNATAQVATDGSVTVWAPTQSPVPAQLAAAKAAGVPQAKVTVNVTLLGGGFGRRLTQDFVADAVEVAKATGKPVKVMWTREDDMRNDPYRPGSVNALQATLGADGKITAYRHSLALQSANAGIPEKMPGGVDPSWVRGAGDMAYAIPNLLVDGHLIDVKIPVGPWRAPTANANFFATESFVDEVAHAAGKDPVAFRLAMLAPGTPAFEVLSRVAQRSAWGTSVPTGRGRGVAMATWGDAWIAVVAEVSAPSRTRLKVHKMWAVVDVGMPINLDGLEAQVTSGLLYGLSATLHGKITFRDGKVDQKNFNDYEVLHFADAPQFDVEIVQSKRNPVGAGEVATPPVAAAVANALFALDGRRVRVLPLLDQLT
jgi:isoquinoline 1-oxidoreductase beta subunit